MADTPTNDAKAGVEDTQGGPKGDQRGRRRGGRKGKGKGKGGERDRERRSDESRGPHRGGKGRSGRGRDNDRHRDRSDQPLTAGLFAGVADREMPCRIAGCTNTWTWYGTQQIRSLGKPEPKRMCSEHLAQTEGIEDRAMPCRNNWCTNTWLWSRGAQLYQRERQEKLKPPHRLCDQCFDEDKHTEDKLVECKIPECRNSWSWPRAAQLRHRAWVRRQQAKLESEEREEAEKQEAKPADPESETAPVDAAAAAPDAAAPDEGSTDASEVNAAETTPSEGSTEAAAADADGAAPEATASEPAAESGEVTAKESGKPGKRKRRRKRKRKIHDGPPEKLCERCFERLAHLAPIEVPCKVHGCTNTWSWEREGQLRAWATLDNRDDVTELPQPPRRMCNSCFEFVRAHTDREVVCGRPACEKTWTYKTGAQLQDFLAGRSQDPIRLCEDCTRSQFVVRSSQGVKMPPGAEVMPCQVQGCSGSWVYAPGMKLSPADPDAAEPPLDRMCDSCRDQRGAAPRDPRRQQAAASAESDSGPADPAGSDHGPDDGSDTVEVASSPAEAELTEPEPVETEPVEASPDDPDSGSS